MEKPVLRGSAPAGLRIGSLILVVVVFCGTASGFTPESPEVKQSVARAIKYLESDAANDSRLGARALVGMALLKHGADETHPRVVQAAAAIQRAVNNAADPAQLGLDIYSSGLSIIFLVTLDPSKYGAEIEALLRYLQAVQKPHGGWGYPDRQTGDTSMIQYVVLSAWEATQVGFRVPQERIEGVTIWLLKTQDPSGAFGYQGKVSSGFTPVKQSGVRHSMAAAGLGSTYICADLLGLIEPVEEKDEDIPSALKEVKDPDEREPERPKTRIDPRLIREVQSRGNRWMRANYKIDPDKWTHYYLYALERYWSFRELAEGKPEGEPRWYDDGVRYLIGSQEQDGRWESNAGATADTAFGALFLLRSTKKSIERSRDFGAGTLVGGRGIPPATDRVTVRQGQVVAAPQFKAVAQVLAAIDDPGNPEYTEAIEAMAELPAGEARTLVSKHAKKLEQLVGGSSPEARLAAVRALAKTRNVDHVPTLIYALTDPDSGVVLEARDGLRRISRKFDGFGLSDHFTDGELRETIEKWKAWYLAIRPDAEFEE